MSKIPCATYRLQLNPKFSFNNAIDVLEYLSVLNISHVYTSPYLQPAKGSMHGYDVADHSKINEELGGLEGHNKFCAALKVYGLGHVVDIVPNHMIAKCPDNGWWTDVLRHGLISPYAKYFDIDWQLYNEKLPNKILLPFLLEHYDEALLNKKIQLKFTQNIFTINYLDQIFPISSFSLAELLIKICQNNNQKKLKDFAIELRDILLEAKNHLDKAKEYYSTVIILEKKIIDQLKDNQNIYSTVLQKIEDINNSYDKLNAFLQEQHYYLVYWRVSNFLISYRRFFHINNLVALRVEDDDVLKSTHNLVLQWFQNGLIDGIRIDHIDGLYDPLLYLNKLSNIFPETWIVAEKILLKNELLPENWPISGTTGYDFLNNVMELFIDLRHEELFTDFYVNFIGGKASYYEVLRNKKLLVLHTLFGGDINFLAELFWEICKDNNYCYNFTHEEIKTAIIEVIACFPIYRTYIRAKQKQISINDKKIILENIRLAKKNQPKLDSSLFDFLQDILLLNTDNDSSNKFIMRFQQLTGPAMAKGQEDTAFYCYNRFIVLNEVGGDPSIFGTSVENFHEVMKKNSLINKRSLLATSTHDTKRSEDIRARLVLLSEIPNEWFAAVKKWILYNEKHYAQNLPDRNTQYFLYQNLVGAWPIAKERVLFFMEKSIREAKTHTSWIYPDTFYEKKLADFVEKILDDSDFCSSVDAFVKPLVYFGRVNSLAQTAIKLTAPGIPDFYQGTELWNFNFVDPDNRRPIDLKLHYELFKEMQSLSLDEIMLRIDEGFPKMWLIQKTLTFRRKHNQLFDDADYLPLYLHGEKSKHGIAFLRGSKVLTFVPRLVAALKNEWGDTYLDLPKGSWRNILTDEILRSENVRISDMVKKFPVTIFAKEE